MCTAYLVFTDWQSDFTLKLKFLVPFIKHCPSGSNIPNEILSEDQTTSVAFVRVKVITTMTTDNCMIGALHRVRKIGVVIEFVFRKLYFTIS
jgi:hypothetical protein